MTKRLTKPIAFLSAVAMLMTMLLYLPSSVFSDMGLGLSANAEEITPTEPSTEDGVYQITSAAELYWFAALVNGTLDGVTQDRSANAKLINDITVNENLLRHLNMTQRAMYQTAQVKQSGRLSECQPPHTNTTAHLMEMARP